jgi:hypothetical protein
MLSTPIRRTAFAAFNVVPVGRSFAIKAHYVGSNPHGGRFGAVVRERLNP